MFLLIVYRNDILEISINMNTNLLNIILQVYVLIKKKGVKNKQFIVSSLRLDVGVIY